MNWQEEQIELLKKGFIVQDCTIGGDECVLIYPSRSIMFEINWNEDLLKYRSSVWLKNEKKLISASFKKFTNWGEREDLFPLPTTLIGANAVEKIDGSTLIVSRYKGELIARTRGTVDASKLDNGFEIEILKQQYPQAFNNLNIEQENCSFIYEWVSPVNKIVINYGDDPDIYLTGMIWHDRYEYASQDCLNNFAQLIGVKRPPLHSFKSINEMIESIKQIKGKEGVCLYYNRDQSILKIKGEDYLAKHAFKSHCTIDSIIDMFLSKGRPAYQEFMSQLYGEFDFECVEMARGFVSIICEEYKGIEKFLLGAEKFVQPLRGLPRKDVALKILDAYGNTNRAGFVFSVLDNKPLDNMAYRKLLYQMIKK
jgi:hypothetical protein